MRKILALIGLLTLPLSGCAAVAAATTSKPTGFQDISTLQKSIEIKMDQGTLDNNTLADTGKVNSVTCVHEAGNVYTCLVDWETAPNMTLKVTVADDGNSWVSTGDN